MKVIKRTFEYGVKKSKNYNSISISEGLEVDLEGVDDTVSFTKMKTDLKKKVDEEVNDEIEKL